MHDASLKMPRSRYASRGGRNINKNGRNFLGARMQDTDGYGWSEPLTIDVDNWHPRFDRPLWYYMAATKGWPYFLRARFLSRIRFNILRFDGNFSFFFLYPITILISIYKYRYFDVVHRFVDIWIFITKTEEISNRGEFIKYISWSNIQITLENYDMQ